MADDRIGFAFQNPDLDNDHYYPGWGLLVSPDELRYVIMFGTKLVGTDAAQTYTDETLLYYADQAIGLLETDFGIDIYPRNVRYNDPIDRTSGARVPRSDFVAANEANLIREAGYPYRLNQAQYYLYTKLRRRPLQGLKSAKLVDPIQSTLLDVYTWRHEKIGLDSTVSFFPSYGASLAGYPMIYSRSFFIRYPFPDFPEALMLDYVTGWESAAAVPADLREAVRKLAGIMLMADFGDGRTAAVASQSASLNTVSESLSTTMSATSAMYGARIMQFQKDLKIWYDQNRRKYSRAVFGVF